MSCVDGRTKPKLWALAKQQAIFKMGGRHSARAMQEAGRIYRSKGGGYCGKGTKAQRKLMKWTAEDWRTASGKKACKKSASGKYSTCDRYLPAKAWKELSPQARAATQRMKRRSRKQYVRNAPKARSAGQKARRQYEKKYNLGASTAPKLKYISWVIIGGVVIFAVGAWREYLASRESEIVVENEITPGLGEITVVGYKKGVAQNIKVKELTQHPGHYLQLEPWSAFETMERQANADGVTFKVNSSFRSMDKQKQLYSQYKAGTGPLAAKPGYSSHQMGLTVDLKMTSPVKTWMAENASAFGFKQTVRSENWHWEYVG